MNLKIFRATDKHKFTLLQKQIRHVDTRLAEVMPANDYWSGSCSRVLPESSENTLQRDPLEIGSERHQIGNFWIVRQQPPLQQKPESLFAILYAQ